MYKVCSTSSTQWNQHLNTSLPWGAYGLAYRRKLEFEKRVFNSIRQGILGAKSVRKQRSNKQEGPTSAVFLGKSCWSSILGHSNFNRLLADAKCQQSREERRQVLISKELQLARNHGGCFASTIMIYIIPLSLMAHFFFLTKWEAFCKQAQSILFEWYPCFFFPWCCEMLNAEAS